MFTGRTSSLSLKIRSITSITRSSAWMQPRLVEAGGLCDLVREVDRALAERDDLDRRVVGDRLGDDVDGVRVVEDPRVRADPLHLAADVLQHVDRSQRHEEASRALGLLA